MGYFCGMGRVWGVWLFGRPTKTLEGSSFSEWHGLVGPGGSLLLPGRPEGLGGLGDESSKNIVGESGSCPLTALLSHMTIHYNFCGRVNLQCFLGIGLLVGDSSPLGFNRTLDIYGLSVGG